MTYWAFDEFASELEEASRRVEKVAGLTRQLLPVSVQDPLYFETYMVYYHLRVAAVTFREIAQWAQGITPDGGAGLTWAEIYSLIETAYSLSFWITEFQREIRKTDEMVFELQRTVGAWPGTVTADILGDLDDLRGKIDRLGVVVSQNIMRVATLEEMEAEPWEFPLNPWGWLQKFTEGLGDFLGSLAALPAEVLINAGERIFEKVW